MKEFERNTGNTITNSWKKMNTQKFRIPPA